MTDDRLRFWKAPYAGQFGLNEDTQFIAGLIKLFRWTPCMTTDKVETGSPEHPEVMQVLGFVEMRIRSFREIAVFGNTSKVSDSPVNGNSVSDAFQGSGSPGSFPVVEYEILLHKFQSDRIKFRIPV